ncbi:acyltransferase family protein [Nonomuraea sp. NPDC050556]|uniref:acyltransferase family protein n=1 Tax=Nonomuraea sp. NPDC050556 TaxID=3364369 RepID=UPI003799A0A5
MAVTLQRSQVPATTRRLAWLDALRGIAALVVVYEHALKPLLPEARQAGGPWFAPGWYGVLVFFLVSGYIVPASLERKGSVRDFWISRVFRLYPLWAVCVAGALLLAVVGLDELHIWNTQRPVAAIVGHLTMLQDLLNVPNVVNVLWTLSYEMSFYLLLTAMFVLGWHRRSLHAALGFAVVGVAGASVLPSVLWSHGWSATHVVVIVVACAVVCGLVAVLRGGATVRKAGAVLLAVTALALLTCNGRFPAWQSLTILATMFSGTVLYRAEQGEISWPVAALVVLVPVGMVAVDGSFATRAATVAAWASFAIGMALRHREMPRVLAWLGLVSYSVYLLHPLLLETVDGLLPHPEQVALGWRLVMLAGVVGLLLGLSALTWCFVEAPAQRWGRRLAGR